MSKFTSMLLAPLAAAGLCMPALAPVSAGPIVVESREAMVQFQKEVTRDLDRQLVFAENAVHAPPRPGYVKIRFRLDEKRRPTKLKTIANTSGTSGERISQKAISRLRDLDRAPVKGAGRALFQANIAFAESESEHNRMIAEMVRDDRVRLARTGPVDGLIIIGS